MAFLLRYAPGLRLDDIMHMTPTQMRAYMDSTVKLLKAENGVKDTGAFTEDGPIISDEAAKVIADNKIAQMKKKYGENYKPQITDLIGTGVI